MIMNKLAELARSKSPFCAGIDLRIEEIPEKFKREKISESLFNYAKICIDSALEYAACFKVQIACYEAHGIEGMIAYKNIISYIKEKGSIVIADIKRGDIGSTAKLYAKGHFEGDFEADVLTINAYMGIDAVEPYFEYFGKKGIFVLAKTSNIGSRDFQDLEIKNSSKLYLEVLSKIKAWNSMNEKSGVFSSIGAVVAVNELKDIAKIKELSDDLFLLIPGYGAQGASIKDIKKLIETNKNAVVNISRAYTNGLKNHENPEEELRKRAFKFSEELKECIK